MKIYEIQHPQVGAVHVREVQNWASGEPVIYHECTPKGMLVRSAAAFYQNLTEEQVLGLGGKLVDEVSG